MRLRGLQGLGVLPPVYDPHAAQLAELGLIVRKAAQGLVAQGVDPREPGAIPPPGNWIGYGSWHPVPRK